MKVIKKILYFSIAHINLLSLTHMHTHALWYTHSSSLPSSLFFCSLSMCRLLSLSISLLFPPFSLPFSRCHLLVRRGSPSLFTFRLSEVLIQYNLKDDSEDLQSNGVSLFEIFPLALSRHLSRSLWRAHALSLCHFLALALFPPFHSHALTLSRFRLCPRAFFSAFAVLVTHGEV